jgi:hypothetical protein
MTTNYRELYKNKNDEYIELKTLYDSLNAENEKLRKENNGYRACLRKDPSFRVCVDDYMNDPKVKISALVFECLG